MDTLFAIFLISLLIFISLQSRKINELKSLIKYSKQLSIEIFKKHNPDFGILYPFGNMSNDFDGYIQYINAEGRKILRLTWSHAKINPLRNGELEVDLFSAEKYLQEKNLQFKKRGYSMGEGILNILEDSNYHYEQSRDS